MDHRIVNDISPKFIDNINAFNRIICSSINFNELYNELECLFHKGSVQFGLFPNVAYINQIFYNAIIEGKTLENAHSIKEINQLVNEYNIKQKEKSKCSLKLKPLFNQILSNCNAISWLPKEI